MTYKETNRTRPFTNLTGKYDPAKPKVRLPSPKIDYSLEEKWTHPKDISITKILSETKSNY